MRIDSMDASFKPIVSTSQTQTKPEVSTKQVNNISVEPNEDTQEKISDVFLERAIDKVNHTFEIQNRSLRFKVHERTNEIMVKIIDTETKEVIREIPPEKLLDMFANMLEMAGLLVDERR